MIGPHEPLVAHGARKPLLAGVRTQMSLQLVRPGKPFATEQPVAHERPFARVPPEVRLQVRRLAVHLAATRYVAAVHVFLEMAAGWAQALGLLTVGTVACGAARVPALRTW